MLSIINNSCFNQNIIKTCVRNKQMEVYIKRIHIRRYKRTNEILQNTLLLNPTQVVRNCLSRFFSIFNYTCTSNIIWYIDYALNNVDTLQKDLTNANKCRYIYKFRFDGLTSVRHWLPLHKMVFVGYIMAMASLSIPPPVNWQRPWLTM